MRKEVIGVDLGGTFLRVGKLGKKGIVDYRKKKTPKSKKKLLVELEKSIKEIGNPSGIGVASPGPLDSSKGIIKNPPNLPFKNFNLKSWLERKFKCPVKIENDANCVALAEARLGCKKKNFIILTLGTGIGGGIIIHNRLYKGRGYGGELGHIILHNGKYFEELAAWKRTKQLTRKYFNKDLLIKDLLDMNDRRAKEIIEEVADYLGQGIASLINIFDPEVVVLAGGVRETGDKFLKKINKYVKQYQLIPHKCKIKWSKLSHPGTLGASLLI
ncbi:MAG: ROK family protein [Candidatus Nanoarchaeia archaeon]